MSEGILVVGAGTMGAGIAAVAAVAGYRVELCDADPRALARARERIARSCERAGVPERADSVSYLEGLPARSEAAVAVEAVVELPEAKRNVVRVLESALSPEALIATNTSSLSVSEIAGILERPERMLGLHFFNPPEKMALVEIVRAERTSDDAIERARAIVERLGKTGIVCRDVPGFVVNRVARPFYLQALRAVERELAPYPELDVLARGIGFRMGPFELMDLIGLDVNLAVSESVYARTGAERLRPSEIQRAMVSQGRLGRKSGRGFYDYDGGAPVVATGEESVSDCSFDDERIVVTGFGELADELAVAYADRCAHLMRIENDDLVDEYRSELLEATVVIDAGDGSSDRGAFLRALDAVLPPACVILADAYVTDLGVAAARMRHPERLVGFGVLGRLERQRAVEIVGGEWASDDTVSVAQEAFECLGRRTVIVRDLPGLFLGRLVGSIVNEAMIAVSEGVADPLEIDLAMRLGTNYPLGPIAWGREIGGARLTRILNRLAAAEGKEYAPHRSLRLLDVADETEVRAGSYEPEGRPVL